MIKQSKLILKKIGKFSDSNRHENWIKLRENTGFLIEFNKKKL